MMRLGHPSFGRIRGSFRQLRELLPLHAQIGKGVRALVSRRQFRRGHGHLLKQARLAIVHGAVFGKGVLDRLVAGSAVTRAACADTSLTPLKSATID